MNNKTKSLLTDYLLGIQHIGYVVDDIEKAIAEWQAIYGFADTEIVRIPVNPCDAPTLFALFSIQGTEIELIEPKQEPFLTLLKNSNSGAGGINHLAWRVTDLDAAYAELQRHGIHAGYVTPNGIVNFGSKKILYLDPKTTAGHLIELIEIME